MTTATQAPPAPRNNEENLPAIGQPRLPYHPAVEERFGIDKAGWKALVEAVFPNAQTTESVILALSYCRARKLDPFKKNVHIVPIWDKNKGRMVDTVWPGIGELRTTAFRTGLYAGRDGTKFGEAITQEWDTKNGKVRVTFPEWAQVTVYRVAGGERVAFAGPPVYWTEAFAETKDGSPNSMWTKRPRGQLDKCAEAAALRAAFPEEIGDEFTDTEAGLFSHRSAEPAGQPRSSAAALNEAMIEMDEAPQEREVFDGEAAEGAADDSPADDPRPTQEEPQATVAQEAGPQAETQAEAEPEEGLEPWEQLIGQLAEKQQVSREAAAERLSNFAAKLYKADLSELEDSQVADIAQKIDRGEIKVASKSSSK